MADNSRINNLWLMLKGAFHLEYSDTLSDLDISIIPKFLDKYKENLKITEEEFSILKNYFEQEFTTQHDIGYGITDDDVEHEKWWKGKLQKESDNFYWGRLERHLEQSNSLARESIGANDKDTDAIMDLISNPSIEMQKRRGMVIGQVQAGKTLNYSTLICKAADAGFKYIILLAGLTNSLRTQTQERIDESFVGRISSLNTNVKKRVGVGKIDASRTPFSLTFFKQDFLISNLQAVKGLDLDHINDINEPLVFVCKKNVNTLKNINEFFSTSYNANQVKGPLLLIDDEADNASVNTKAKKKDITAINSGIREIIKKFTNSTYLGYTATPFANIFIDNDNEDEITKDDLFPKDFIWVLDTSNKYVSAKRVFGVEGDLGDIMLRVINDNDGYIKKVHKKEENPIDLPPTLKEAIRIFLLSKAVRNSRKQKNKHCSMMVNVSRFNDVQDRIKTLIFDYIMFIKEDLRLNGSARKPSTKSIIHQLKVDYEAEFLINSDKFEYPSWDSISSKIFDIVDEVDILTVNMKAGELNYRDFPKGRTVIAIGGFALSRGLTLEGLVTTYILRNAAAYDTLLQLGRWFGYRPNYEDLCRLYIDAESLRYYSDISETIDELVEEIKEMKQLGLTPTQFGLKIRENPGAIRITAANKMNTAELLTLELGFRGKLREGHTLFNDDDINNYNRNVVYKFLEQLEPKKASLSYPNAKNKPTWSNVDVNKILEFIESFKLPAKQNNDLFVKSNGRSFVSDFIRDKQNFLKNWIVCVNNQVSYSENSEKKILDGFPLEARKNQNGELLDNKTVFGITSSRRVGSPDDLAIGLNREIKGEKFTKNLRDKIQVPILNIYINSVSIPVKDSQRQNTNLTEFSVTYSLYIPNKSTLSKTKVQYQVNKIFKELNLVEEPDYDEDDYTQN